MEFSDMLTELSRREKEANIQPDPDIDVYMKAISVEGQESVVIDYILKVGLEVCADTMVGDSMIRGISGGQKKRVTTAKALFMDEISTSLDSSTTYQIVNSLRQSVHILGGTALIALLQPAPETYELFDDIVLLSEGQIVYQGPRENVLEFFEAMGFKCPERKGVADFLQEVTSRKDQYQYWCRRDEPYRYISVNDFSEAFKAFHVGRKLGSELKEPFDRTRNHPAALTTSKYGISKMELLRACFSREWLLMKRNSFVYIFKVVQTWLRIPVFWAFPERAVFIDNEILVSLDNVGIWNLHAEKLDNWYRGQEVYVKVADPLGYNITEMVIPDNALHCGLLKERQTPQVHESNSKSSAQGDAGWSNKLLTTMILVVAAVIFS
ncbi:ABC transporter G family member 39-like [Miscanthus floridulus]|uniref:ABC transporter G family member 39-like n=1 Tax=Miscanthus floridulus TaxID=154761 RepID=UPI0034576BB7